MKIGSGQNFHEAVALGRRYVAKQALEAGIAQAVAGAADVVPDAKTDGTKSHSTWRVQKRKSFEHEEGCLQTSSGFRRTT